MGHGGITLIGAIRNSLLYSVGYRSVSMRHFVKALVGVIGNILLNNVGDR